MDKNINQGVSSNVEPGHTRLGRGLSSLMAKTAKVEIPSGNSSKNSALATEGAAKKGFNKINTNDTIGESNSSESIENNGVPRGTPANQNQEDNGEAILDLQYIPIDKLKENSYQPRKKIDADTLNWLAQSIKSEGVMQPIVVRRQKDGDGYEIIAGERRWRAAKLAGVTNIPATVRDLSDRQSAEWALIENVQREDLNPMDRAEAFAMLASQFELSHKEIGEKVGLERTSVANFFKLLSLCDEVKDYVRNNSLSSSKGRIIARLSDAQAQKSIAKSAIKQELTVKQLESKVSSALDANGSRVVSSVATKNNGRAQYLADLERQLTEQLNTKVHIKPGRKKGTGALTVEFYSLNQFDDLMSKLGVTME